MTGPANKLDWAIVALIAIILAILATNPWMLDDQSTRRPPSPTTNILEEAP